MEQGDIMMNRDMEVQNNNIGTVIQYFRETYHISQKELCRGICSVSTLSRIEAGERDVDALILETLLERLGKEPIQFELILNDFDYNAYIYREEIKKKLKEKDIDDTYKLLRKYEKLTKGKGSPHKQFVIANRAYLNELEGGDPKVTIELLMKAILCTVPDFNTNEISDYFLSLSEFNIILDILQRMISLKMDDKAERIVNHVINYLYRHENMSQNRTVYVKATVIAGKFFMDHKKIDKAMEIINTGFRMYKGCRKIENIGELHYLNAQLLEKKYKTKLISDMKIRQECIKQFLESYYVFNFSGNYAEAENIKKHLREVYQWEDID